ncbi:glutathione S-transferase family protein [Bradyrhizobium lablabi]|uniref:glutathione S-transferase family protein n=1 Tax=Bradyrhizobium lablabi TaxID=722472 RepID=UPI001BA59AD9|nr:glutathione S-transferase family protein [Bradyrhizobium lablabi]MBR0697832.1 glutathione S-transferase family protein [Bradyrhizobium lablabi]
MLRIYGAPHSRAFCVIWLANDIGIPYELIPVTFSLPNAQCKEPWYLALNPNGLVPAIDDGGFVVWETAAINLYLAETYKNFLYPSKPQGRGRMLQWAFFATTEVEPALITLFRNRIFFPPEQRNETLAVQAEETLRAKLAILEDQLVKTQFFGGGTWDMADFMVASVLCVLARLELDLTSYPRFDAWLAASLNRPAAQAARILRE